MVIIEDAKEKKSIMVMAWHHKKGNDKRNRHEGSKPSASIHF
jgi:hypothetical protein